MLIQQPKVCIVSRQVSLGNGEAALAFFALINVGGAVEVRFLGSKPLSAAEVAASATAPAAVLLLENPIVRFVAAVVYRAVEYVAAFVSSLEFLTSQPARAPARV
jgi:hypothetical protein